MRALGRALDRLVEWTVHAGAWLVVPVCVLLFLQWPLRDVVQAYSREANDMAQVLFALYVGIAITSATRSRAHLATDVVARRQSPRMRDALSRFGALLVLAPWALFMLYTAWPMTAQSLRQLEAFPETFNPGYFMLKGALLLAMLLVLLQALLDAAGFRSRDKP